MQLWGAASREVADQVPWHSMAQYGTVWHGMARHKMVGVSEREGCCLLRPIAPVLRRRW